MLVITPFTEKTVRLESHCACCMEPITLISKDFVLQSVTPPGVFLHISLSPYDWNNVGMVRMCDAMNYVLIILGMAAITLLIRTTVFIVGERLVFPPLVRTALGFVPVTVLTAIIVPMAVSPHGNGAELTWRNPQLVGALAAVVVSALTRRPLLTIAVGLATFFLWQGIVLK